MARSTTYYTLIGSLPALPRRFEQAERVPISRLKLDERLKMLTPQDAEEVTAPVDVTITVQDAQLDSWKVAYRQARGVQILDRIVTYTFKGSAIWAPGPQINRDELVRVGHKPPENATS